MSAGFWESLWQVLVGQGAGLTILLAAISDGLGSQSIVLLVNRITPLRFALNLLLSVALYFLSALAWMTSIWLAAGLVLGDHSPLPQLIGAVSLAYIPLWFSALALIPYLGQAIGPLLNAWSLAIALGAVSLVFNFGLLEALLGTALGWLALVLVRTLLGRPSDQLGHWLWAATTGRDRRIDLESLPLSLPGEPAAQPPALHG